jgi:hypothetical protein
MKTAPLFRIALACLLALSPQIAGAQADTSAATTAPAKKRSGKVAPASPVDLNTASAADLEKVPGIGASTAKKIVANRPYASAAELTKAGLKAKEIESLTPMVTASAVAAPTPAAVAPPKPARKAPVLTYTPQPTAAAPTAPVAAPTTAAAKPAAQPPGPGMVWVNTSTKVFHREGSKFYGNTKSGKYMTEADAVSAGYRAAKREPKNN